MTPRRAHSANSGSKAGGGGRQRDAGQSVLIDGTADLGDGMFGFGQGWHREAAMAAACAPDEIGCLPVKTPGEFAVGGPAGMADDTRRRRHQLQRDVAFDQAGRSPLDIEQKRIERAVAAEPEAITTGLDAEGFFAREFAEELARQGVGMDVDDHSNGFRG